MQHVSAARTPVPAAAYTGTEVSVWRCCKTVLAFLAATGAAALFWLLTGWLRRREPARAVLLVPARGSGDFSGPVAQLLDLRRQLRGLPPIVICDCGLDEEGLSRARELTQRYDNVLLLAPEEIVQNLP